MLRAAIVGTLIGLCLAQAPAAPKRESKCNEESFQTCFKGFYHDMEVSAVNGNAESMNPVIAMCRNYYEIYTCMREKVNDCEPVARQVLTALQKGLEYLCHDNHEETYELAKCMLKDPAKEEKIMACSEQMWKQKVDVMRGSLDSKRMMSRMCGIVKQWETCIERETSQQCNAGEVASSFFERIHKNLPSEMCGDELNGRDQPVDKTPPQPVRGGIPEPRSWRPPFDPSGYFPSQEELLCKQPMKVEQCMAPIMMSHEMGPPETVEEICSMAERMERCIDSVSDMCNEESKLIWTTLRKVVNYACVERRAEFRDSFQCLKGMAMDLPDMVMNCVEPQRMIDDSGEGSSEEKPRSPARSDFNKRKMCWFLGAYKDCMGVNVEARCGEEARDFLDGMFSLVNEYTEDKLDVHCEGHTDLPIRGYEHHRMSRMLKYGLAAGVPALVVVIVLVIIIVVLCRRRSTQQAKTDKCVLVKHDLLHENMKQAMAETSPEKQKV